MKLCILGGGGFRMPYVYQALLRDHGSPRVQEVVAVRHRRAPARGHDPVDLAELAEPFADAPIVKPSADLAEAVTGSDFVFAAIRVGGLEGRRCDEHVALDLSVLGQETTGPGGFAYALRTVPVMLTSRSGSPSSRRRRTSSTSPTRPASSPRRCRPSSGTGCSASATPRRAWAAGSPGLLGLDHTPDPDGLHRTQPPGLDAPGALRRPGRAP